MTRNFIRFLLIASLAAFVAGCEHAASGLDTVRMQIGKQTFTLEIANTPATEEHGLMERDSMPADHGMIFVFPDEQERSFWMKNTRFPLDILFLDAAGKVVSIHQMRAYDLNTTPSDYPAKYAIELNAGAAEKASVNVGDKLSVPAPAREPKAGK